MKPSETEGGCVWQRDTITTILVVSNLHSAPDCARVPECLVQQYWHWQQRAAADVSCQLSASVLTSSCQIHLAFANVQIPTFIVLHAFIG
jgi:hypothetical protein